jgi:hypothetical protein
VVGSGSHKDGFGGALDGGTTATCGSNFNLLIMLQRAAAAASSLGCGASLRGVRGLHGGGAARLGPARLTTLEVVCGAVHVGNGFLGERCGARDIIGTSLSGV